MMSLVYLTANAAWSFTFGDDLIRMGDAPMFHPTRRSALDAALACGLLVTSDGQVHLLDEWVTAYAEMADV